jgi:hypothetical protein
MEGFKGEDFNVYVDGEARRIIVFGSDGKALWLHNTFQLPDTANHDTITYSFDSNVLTLTMPKLPAAPAPPPPPQAKEEARVAGGKKPADQEGKLGAKVGGGHGGAATEERTTAEAEERTTSLTASSKEEDEKARPTAPPPPPPQSNEKAQDHQDGKARAGHREMVAREAARRIEAARARVAEAKAKAELERKWEHWKERAVEEGVKLAEALNKNKEVIATAVAAFALGVLVSNRIFCRN